MSRIGKKPIAIPDAVKVQVAQRKVTVEGPAGRLEHTFPHGVSIAVEGKTITIGREHDSKEHRAYHGMTRALINNMVNGAKAPFEKILEVHGTGFAAAVAGKNLELEVGFTNKIIMPIPKGLEVKIDKQKPVVLRIVGADKQAVGQLSAEIRKIRPPSPYGDNKGIRYKDEQIRKKAGKAFGEKK
jgi:large subunit ribosomal protein L6